MSDQCRAGFCGRAASGSAFSGNADFGLQVCGGPHKQGKNGRAGENVRGKREEGVRPEAMMSY
jgi:hypothetical protein